MSDIRDWGGFGDALRRAIEDAENERIEEPTACPVCGLPLVRNLWGVLGCPAGDWQSTF